MPWHYDHHMGLDQDQNWCVTWPLMDHLFGTRVKWVGTEKEAEQWAKLEARLAEKPTASSSHAGSDLGTAPASVS